MAVIKPNITTVFNLQRELETLQTIDTSYNNVIDKIINIQTTFETIRDSLFVIDESLPPNPDLSSLINNLKKTCVDSNINIDKLTISEINLKQDGKDKKNTGKIEINLETVTTFEDFNKFIKSLLAQRRLKTVKNIIILKSDLTKDATISSKLIIDGYHL
jgi:Tfp pilus assembly protein PilO